MPDCPCDVWCRGLTTCFQYVGPRFWKSSLKDDKFVSLTYFFFIIFYLYLDASQYDNTLFLFTLFSLLI